MRVLVLHFINTTTFAAGDFWPRRGASDAHTLQGSVRSEQRRLGQKEPPPGGLRRIWLLALLLLGHRALAAMLPRRASPEAKCGATNVVVFMKRGTKPAFCGRAGRFRRCSGPTSRNLRRVRAPGPPASAARPRRWCPARNT